MFAHLDERVGRGVDREGRLCHGSASGGEEDGERLDLHLERSVDVYEGVV